jgi:hypothetical protein
LLKEKRFEPKGVDQMSTTQIIQKSWQIIWRYRALWIFSMVLALTAANTIYLGPWQDKQNVPLENKIKINKYSTIILPGEGLTIDFTTPGGPNVILTDGPTRRDFQSLTDLARQAGLSNLIAVATEILILVILISLITTVARYVAETAMIRMVSETEETGKQLTLRQGLRLGWSARAGRLFLIDLLVGLVSAGIVVFLLSLIIGPILLVESTGIWAILLTAFSIFGLLIFTVLLFFVWRGLLSLVMQTVRRACVIDDMGVFASIKAGFTLLKNHFKEVGITWLLWIAIRILWAPGGVLAAIILAPILLIFVLAGMLLSVVPAAFASAIASLFVNGLTPWIIGLIAGLPIFILVIITPLLLVGGWVEIFKSSLWTLTYRALRVSEPAVQAVQPQRPLVSAHGVAD